MKNTNIWNDKYLLENENLEKKHIEKLRKELIKSENRRRHNEIIDVKNSNTRKSARLSKLTTSKVLIYMILLNCFVVEGYSMYVMFALADLSALSSLIGAIISESISYAIYCAKSYKETNAEEILKFEKEKFAFEQECRLSESEQRDLENVIPDEVPEDDDHSGDIPEGEIMYESDNE